MLPEFLNRRRAGFTYPLRVIEELGIDRPTLVFVVNAVALQGAEGARLEDLFNPYVTVRDQWLAPSASARAAGLVDEAGDRWRLTAAGSELFARVRRAADAYFATLEPIPAAELRALAVALQRAFDAVAASDVPPEHIPRAARFAGDARIPMVALENAVFGLWQARDDCHMASWRARGFDGPTFDVLTRVWRREAADADGLSAKLAQQRQADVSASLARLRRDGLVAPVGLTTTERGALLRQEVEDETDRRFFGPWPDDVGARADWLRDRLAAVNAAFT